MRSSDAGRRTHSLHGADRDHIRIVARGHDRAISVGSGAVIPAVIPGRYHDDNARLPGLLDGLAERILSVALRDGPSQTQVDDPDVIGIFQGDSLADRRDHDTIAALRRSDRARGG